jgi:hypothetical protein
LTTFAAAALFMPSKQLSMDALRQLTIPAKSVTEKRFPH